MSRRWRLGVSLAVAAPLLYLGAVMISIAAYAGRFDDQPSDAAVVLGAAVSRGRPTPVFEERIRHAIDLHRRGRVPRLILTGGVGFGDTAAEAQVAADYCRVHGVPAAALFTEVVSHSTRENLEQARAIAAAQGARRLLIVSDPLHMRRALTIAHDLGLDAHPSPTPTTRYVGLGARAKFLLRETYFLGRYLLARR